jgi:hypothetical protein
MTSFSFRSPTTMSQLSNNTHRGEISDTESLYDLSVRDLSVSRRMDLCDYAVDKFE